MVFFNLGFVDYRIFKSFCSQIMTDIVFAFQLVIDCMIRPYRRNILLSLCLLLPSTMLPLCPGFGLSSYKTILPTHQPTIKGKIVTKYIWYLLYSYCGCLLMAISGMILQFATIFSTLISIFRGAQAMSNY